MTIVCDNGGDSANQIVSLIGSNRECSANAAHIVKCVNMHEDLISMIKEFRTNLSLDKTIPIFQKSTDLLERDKAYE